MKSATSILLSTGILVFVLAAFISAKVLHLFASNNQIETDV